MSKISIAFAEPGRGMNFIWYKLVEDCLSNNELRTVERRITIEHEKYKKAVVEHGSHENIPFMSLSIPHDFGIGDKVYDLLKKKIVEKKEEFYRADARPCPCCNGKNKDHWQGNHD